MASEKPRMGFASCTATTSLPSDSDVESGPPARYSISSTNTLALELSVAQYIRTLHLCVFSRLVSRRRALVAPQQKPGGIQ